MTGHYRRCPEPQRQPDQRVAFGLCVRANQMSRTYQTPLCAENVFNERDETMDGCHNVSTAVLIRLRSLTTELEK